MPKIDVNREIEKIIDHIKDYFVSNGNENTKAVSGISGGKDSTVAAALLVRALGCDRVIGVMMPQGKQKDISDSRKVCEILGIKSYEIDIGYTCAELYRAIDEVYDDDHMVASNPVVATNTPARIRMSTLYAVAALVGGRVINTGNASELYVGYTTKYGDLAGDFALFSKYHVRDILEIGIALSEIPSHLVLKAPGDGMSGKTDEDNLGFSYETLDAYLIDGEYPDYDTLLKIEERHQRNLHKHAVSLPSIPGPRRQWEKDECSRYKTMIGEEVF